jgi:hypothetical protein
MTRSASEGRPINPRNGEPLLPRAQPGYYPRFNTLSQKSFWDEATRKVVLDRVENVPPIRFFTADEVELMTAVCDRIVPQDDRDSPHKIPIVNFIDQRLNEGRIDGYRFEGMPSDAEAHRLGLQGIEQVAQHMFGRPFVALSPLDQEAVLQTLHDGAPPAGREIWRQMSVHRFWLMLVQDVVSVYYAHPYAWDEIGFGGPAYPRGYMRLEGGEPEPWEVNEQRYEWAAPAGSRSAEFTLVAGSAEDKGSPHQGGAL